MHTALRRMGNSTGMILPKPILTALGVSSGATMALEVENGRVIVTPVKRTVREGWAEAAKVVGALPLTDDDREWLSADTVADDDWEW